MPDRTHKQQAPDQRGVQEVAQTAAAIAVTAKVIYDVNKDRKPKK